MQKVPFSEVWSKLLKTLKNANTFTLVFRKRQFILSDMQIIALLSTIF